MIRAFCIMLVLILFFSLIATVQATACAYPITASGQVLPWAYRPKPLKRQEAQIITISTAGDCTLGTDYRFPYKRSFLDVFKKHGNDPAYNFSNVLPIFAEDDLTLVNLEGTLTTAKTPREKAFVFKGPPEYRDILVKGSIEVVNLSNNHIYDYGEKGFRDTIANLEEAGVAYCGEGHRAVKTIKGVKIGFLGYGGWSASRSLKDTIQEDVASLKQECSIVVVSFHWGKERTFYPNTAQQTLGRHSIDCGADLVVGHHPHVLQGIEKYKGKYIVYSLGNFAFGGNRNPGDKDTMIFQQNFRVLDKLVEDKGIQIIPCSVSSVRHTNDYRPTILDGKEKKRVLDRIRRYSSRLKYGIAIE